MLRSTERLRVLQLHGRTAHAGLRTGGARLDRLALTHKQALPTLPHLLLRPNTPLLATRPFSLTPHRFQQTPLPDPPRPASSPSSESSPASFSRRAKAERRLSQLQRDIALVLSRRLHLGGLRAFRSRFKRPTRRQRILLLLGLALAAFVTAYNLSVSFRHGVIAVERCTTIAWAVMRAIIDYKLLFRKSWPETEEGMKQRHDDYENTHWTAAVRLREALKKLGGVYIKLGQHLSTVQLVPLPWSQAMKPLQDQCFPTPLDELQELFLSETGAPMSFFFSSFDPEPIGVASLAQVHRAVDRESGRLVAVKCMHPDIEEFSAIDMRTTTFLLGVVKRIFPTFEFTWLGEEMEHNLPLEMDFRHEAANAARCKKDFADVEKTAFVIPDVLWAKKRVMVMEFIKGGRVDDAEWFERHHIDRNQVSREIARITSRMIYITGFVHGDLHAGNLLIRPALANTRSPYNFEVVLLDHGLYFDLADDLRVNYARFWLSLMEAPSPKTEAARRKYAKLVANIDDAHYPLFQAAITGRAALEGAVADEGEDGPKRRGSILDLGENTDDERKLMRKAMVQQEGLMEALFEILRSVPRRLVLVFKVNDLNRSLDLALQTTHSPLRVFLIIAQYCNQAIRLDDLAHIPPLSFINRLRSWWRYQSWKVTLFVYTVGAEGKTRWDRLMGRKRQGLALPV
ncbi:hypothetical protein NBRC10513_000774 [Rhodotorula toruloides]|uniref:ABC1 family-domain containing protein n=1 Tax=Rhodotorula toruloides TaxID=5286 RepID=A0A0K3CA24_RHOTO|nr:ABC1 family-domain containing protein [Rhodotorula toruloides]